jgi:hypothetical protein
VKTVLVLAFPPGVTTLILPEDAPEGTVTLILSNESEVIAAAVPPNVTCVAGPG